MVYSDNDTAIDAPIVQQWFKDRNIKYITTRTHAAQEERQIRTFKDMLEKRMENNQDTQPWTVLKYPRHHRLKKPATEKVNCYYNLTFGEYRNMRTLQERRCRICKTHEKNLVRKLLCIDHDHTTGKVRELLCNSCNTGLGCFKDNPKLLQKAINYLKKHIKLGNTPAPV